MNVLVTGATGFLGGNLLRHLRACGHAVRGHGRNRALCDSLRFEGFEIACGDLADLASAESACAEMDAVMHVAAYSSPWGKRADFVRSNVTATANLLEACAKGKVPRFIFVSSPSVAFNGEDQIHVTESVPYPRRYLCVYSETKKTGEELVQKAWRDGLHTTIVRPKAIFGPGDTTLLPRLLDAARKGRLPQIGRGTNLVDFTYVDNVSHALALCLTSPASHGKIYTITGGEHVNLWSLVRDVLVRMNLPTNLRPLPFAAAYALAGLMELRATVFGGEPLLTRYTASILGRTQTYDISAAQSDLGYRPVVSIAEGVDRSIEALRGNLIHER